MCLLHNRRRLEREGKEMRPSKCAMFIKCLNEIFEDDDDI